MRAITSDTGNLTMAEEELLAFLMENKGKSFSNEELQTYTGIRASLINRVMDNVRWKGYMVGTSSQGDHYYINNTWKSYLMCGSIFGTILTLMVISTIMAV